MNEITERIERYWTARAHDFNIVRQNELRDAISQNWLAEIGAHLPPDRPLEILDAGTGTGYFAVLLAGKGHAVTGIDLTPAMLAEAEETAAAQGVSVRFLLMDAQKTEFPDASFDAVVTRNLTWTLPDPEAAYREWFRVLRPGGVLLNYDAAYAENVRNHNQSASKVTKEGVYGHFGVTPALSEENAAITLAVPASRHMRPEWDVALCRAAGFSEVSADETAGARILQDRNLPDAPLFLLKAVK